MQKPTRTKCSGCCRPLEKALHEIQVVSAYEWHMPIDVGQLAIPQVVLDLPELTPEYLIYTDASGWENVIET